MAMVIDISGQEAKVEQKTASSVPFLASVLGDFRVHALSREHLPSIFAGQARWDEELGLLPNSLLMATVHHCFAKHIPLSLSPDVLWYVIVNEVATHVRLEPERYRHLFSQSREKIAIQVRDDSLVYGGRNNDWSKAIGLFTKPLQTMIPREHVDVFIRNFSTSTIETQTATLIAFMDIVSCYYSFELVSLCGIPRVRLEGNAEDWADLKARTTTLAEMFGGLDLYFRHLLPVLDKLAAAAGGRVDSGFWRSLFKLNDASGGPYINGWITAFLAHRVGQNGAKPKDACLFDWTTPHSFGGFVQNEFPAHLSKVSFVWNYLLKEIPMWFVSGVMGVDWDRGFLRPRLGYGVLEPRGNAEGDVQREMHQILPAWATATTPASPRWWQFWRR